MNLVDLKKQIVSKNMSNFYIFLGNEIGIMNIYLEKMSNMLAMPIVRLESVLTAYNKCTTRSMFGNEDSIYVIRGDLEITKHEELYSGIQNDLGKNIIVLLYDKLDSRLKFGKHFKDCTIVFEPMTTDVLCKYISKSGLSNRNSEKLSNIVQNSYDVSMLEVDKIKQYADATNLDMDKSFDELLRQHVIYIPQEYDVFQFVDMVMNRNKVNSFRMLNSLLENGGNAVNLLGVLYLKVKCVLLIQVCENDDICGTTGLENREVYYNKKYVGKYTPAKLVDTMKLIARTVDDIKQGRIDDTVATQLVLVSMFSL